MRCETRFSYTSQELRQIGRGTCVGLRRRLRRFLFILGLLHACHRPHLVSSRPIPVRVTSRSSEGSIRGLSPNEAVRAGTPRTLTQVVVQRPRSQRRRHPPLPFPTVILANIRSVYNKLDEISQLVESKQPDVCVFTESWLDDNTPDDAVAIPSYSVVRKDRSDRKGGGILCHLRSVLSYCVFNASDVPSLASCRSEFLILYIKNFHLFLICIYHPFWNDANAHKEAISCISDLLDFAFVKYGSSVRISVIGDFNDLRNHFSCVTRLTRLLPLVEFPTRGSHCLDQIFSNFATDQKPSFLPPIGRSDHLVIFWQPKPHVSAPAVKKKVRKFSNASIAAFHQAIASYDWLSFVSSFDSLDDAATAFQVCLFHLYDRYFPERVIRVRPFEPPWMNVSLKILINERDRAFYCNQWAKYRRLRDDVMSHIRVLKQSFLDALMSENNTSTGSRKMWKSLRCLSRYRKNKSVKSDFTVDDFNAFFSTNFQSDLTNNVRPRVTDTLTEDIPQFSHAEVFHHLCKVPNKCSGPDGVPPWVFRECAHFLTAPIAHLFNRSLNERHMPTCFKLANVVPIPKCEKPLHISDYRPISLLPVLSKTFEKLVVKNFILPVIRDKVSPTQFAYISRPGSGTTSALVLAQHKVLQFLDSCSGAVRVLSIDFSKAFDKLLHSRILIACESFQISPFIIEWISSFLTSRKQRVSVDNHVSSWSSVPIVVSLKAAFWDRFCFA